MEFKLCPTTRTKPRRYPPSRHTHSEVVIGAAQRRHFPATALSGDECVAIRQRDKLSLVRNHQPDAQARVCALHRMNNSQRAVIIPRERGRVHNHSNLIFSCGGHFSTNP